MSGLDLDIDVDGEEYEQGQTQWEGYSDYRKVSQSIATTITNAIKSYAILKRRHTENARVRQETAAEAGMHLEAAALQLLPELQSDVETNQQYESILRRWLGEETLDEVLNDENPALADPSEEHRDGGYLSQLDAIQLHQECPPWLKQFVLDIKTAGFELGYLRAGRERKATERDPVEEESDSFVGGG